MQKIERSNEPPPTLLQSPEAARSRQSLYEFLQSDSVKVAQTSVPRFELSLDHPTIISALRRLFKGRCAFCEAADDLMPYRFRPAAEALPAASSVQSHLYYMWLADAWENIHAICPTCRPSEPNYFPVEGRRAAVPDADKLAEYANQGVGLWRDYPIRERAMLLDPCGETEFYRSLRPCWDGRLIGLSARGNATIEMFNLNHAKRVAQRETRYREYLDMLIAGLSPGQSTSSISSLFDFADLEFGGTWYMLLRRLGAIIGTGGVSGPILSPSRIQRTFMRLYGQPDNDQRLFQIVRRMTEEDARDPVEQSRASVARPSRARMTSVAITNFKSIESLTLAMPHGAGVDTLDATQPVPSLLILGENAAGKSSILEAIALTLASAASREKLSVTAGSLILDPRYLGGAAEAGPRKAAVDIMLSDGRHRMLHIEGDELIGGHDHDREEAIPVFAYGAFRQYQHKARPYQTGKYIRNLFDASVLSNPERWLLGLKDEPFAMVVRALREILSIDGEFEVIERDIAGARCLVRIAVQDPDGRTHMTTTPLGAVSSGFRSVLAMGCDIMQGLMDPRIYGGFETLVTARGVILIDEIEAHLHPRWKMQIMRGLRRALPNMTFIATTHDPLCLRGMNDGEVAVLQRVAAQGSTHASGLPVFVEQLVDLPNISQLRVDQLLTSDLFQLFSTDDPDTETRLARVGDVIARRQMGQGLSVDEQALLDGFERDVATALPIGTSEVHRLVQEAVADYLRERRQASNSRLRALRDTTKAAILRALEGVGDARGR